MCYQIQVHAYLVVLMDTQFFNEKYHIYEDYSIGIVFAHRYTYYLIYVIIYQHIFLHKNLLMFSHKF